MYILKYLVQALFSSKYMVRVAESYMTLIIRLWKLETLNVAVY